MGVTVFISRRALGTLICTLMLMSLNMVCSEGSCAFPDVWRGSWVHYGFGSNYRLVISRTDIESKGRCVASKPDRGRYLMQKTITGSDDTNNICYACLVVTQRTENLLQYKETGDAIQCQEISKVDASREPPPIDVICSQISADETLHTMIRENAVPIPCPFQGAFELEYSRHGASMCHSASSFDRCASDTQQRWQFRQCLELPQSESSTKDIQCLAKWQDGDSWLYVKYGRTDYRCIRYRQNASQQWLLFVSEESSCTGLSSDDTSPLTLKLTREVSKSDSSASCSFPSWFTSTTWQDITGSTAYIWGNVRQGRLSMPTQALITSRQVALPRYATYNLTSSRSTCASINKAGWSKTIETYVAGVVDGCTSGYQCLKLRKLAPGIAVLEKGALTSEQHNACTGAGDSNDAAGNSIILLDEKLKQSCPFTGIYTEVPTVGMQVTCSTRSTYRAGCEDPASLVLSLCEGQVQRLECLANWSADGENLVAVGIKSHGEHRATGACYSFRTDDAGLIDMKFDSGCTKLAFGTVHTAMKVDITLEPATNAGACAGSSPLKLEQGIVPSQFVASDALGGAASSTTLAISMIMAMLAASVAPGLVS